MGELTTTKGRRVVVLIVAGGCGGECQVNWSGWTVSM